MNKAPLSAAGPEIEPCDLPVELLFGRADSTVEEYSLDGLEQQTICRVLAQTGGHQQRAADLLGISRRTLIRKLKLYRSLDGRPHKIPADKIPVEQHRLSKKQPENTRIVA